MDIIIFFSEMPERMRAFIGILFVILTSSVIAFTKSNLFQKILISLFDWISNKKTNKESEPSNIDKSNKENPIGYSIKETDIMNHDLFSYVDFWLYSQIPTINLRTQYRTAVFRKYLNIYYKTYRDSIREYVMDGSYKEKDSAELRRSLLYLITNIIRIMEIEMKECGIPDVVIMKMKNALGDRISLTVDLINSICDSSFYDGDGNYLKIYSFLNIVHSILDNTITNVDGVCNNINGEMVGLSMDGFVEPKGHSKK